MAAYLARMPWWLRLWWPGRLWRVKGAVQRVYLTFDDGPIPAVTPWVLDELERHGAKATFFCIGRNAETEPELLARIRSAGHGVGNHTYDHPNGIRTRRFTYLRSVLRCQRIIGTPLFRPPYGRLTRAQAKALRNRFRLVMWDVLSADFDTTIDGERCVRNVLDHVRSGSVIVFHDSVKAEPRLRHALPRVLAELVKRGYAFDVLPGGLERA